MDASKIAAMMMAVGASWFGAIALPTIIACAFAGPHRDMHIFDTYMPFALLGLIPLFVGVMTLLWSDLMRDI